MQPFVAMLEEDTVASLEAVARAQQRPVEDVARDLLTSVVAIEKRKLDLGVTSVTLPPR